MKIPGVVAHRVSGYEDKRNIAFLGNVDVGKSTLLNTLIGNNVAVTGRGETTTEITPYPVGKNTNSVFWDFPGRTDDVNYANYRTLSFMKGMSKIVLLERTCVSNCTRIIRVLTALHLPFVFVASQDDQFTDEERKRQTSKDHASLQQLGVEPEGRYFRLDCREINTCIALNEWLLR